VNLTFTIFWSKIVNHKLFPFILIGITFNVTCNFNSYFALPQYSFLLGNSIIEQKDLDTTDIEKFKRRGNNAIRLIATHSAEKGLGDQLLNILVKVIEPTRKEEGNIAYVLHRSIDNPDELMFDEIWVDKESLDVHLKQPYIMSAVEQMTSILAKPVELRRYSEIRQ
jgi:quinol monooxygenase YgiN